MAWTPQCTLKWTLRSSEHAAHRLQMHMCSYIALVAQGSSLTLFHSISSCMRTCVWLLEWFSSPVSLLLPPVLFQLYLMPSRRLMRFHGSPCATPAWGAWSLWTMSHPSQFSLFLVHSMACSTANAFDIVCRLDRNGTLDEAPQKKVAAGLLLDRVHEQDLAGPISLRASIVLGPICRYRVADILHHMKLVSRASRPGLTVGVLRILCNGLCAALRFHTEEYDHTCRVGCPNEPDSLTLQRVSPVVRHIYFLLVTCYCTSTEKPSSAWIDHPGVPAKPSIWDSGDGLY